MEEYDKAEFDAYVKATHEAVARRWREVPGAWEEAMTFFSKLGILTERGKACFEKEMAYRKSISE